MKVGAVSATDSIVDVVYNIQKSRADPAEGTLSDLKKQQESAKPSKNQSISSFAPSLNDSSKIKASKDSDDKLALIKQLKLQKLRQRDREVRTHEMAHVLAGGPYVIGGPHYIFVVGPDGKLYAVGGEVKIDLSPVPNDPDATIRKAETIKRAALAPANPSAQDRAVAAKAEQMAMKARMEKLKRQQEKLRKEKETDQNTVPQISLNNQIISYIEQFNKKVSSFLASKTYSQDHFNAYEHKFSIFV